jgi:hypothetical protein
MYHLGNSGNIRVRRATGTLEPDLVQPSDVNVSVKRFSFDSAELNLITGDRLDISTTDPRGLVFFATSSWPSSSVEDTITVFVHVNEAGGLRCYDSFSDAISDTKANALVLQAFSGDPIPVSVTIRDIESALLGDISSYTFNTEREAIDTTVLSDKFRSQYNAGLLTGSGTIECVFSVKDDPRYFSECYGEEFSSLVLQVIQRVDVGAQFDLFLNIVAPGPESANGVFYELHAVATRTGIQVAANELITCSVDFVTTGEFRFRIGSIKEHLLLETTDNIALERDLGFLLKDVED